MTASDPEAPATDTATPHRSAIVKLPTSDQPHFTVGCGICQADIEAPLSEEGVEQAQAFLRQHLGCFHA